VDGIRLVRAIRRRGWGIAILALAGIAVMFVAFAGRKESIENVLKQAAEVANKQILATGLKNDRIRVNSVIAGPGRQVTYLNTVYGTDRITDEQLGAMFVAIKDGVCLDKARTSLLARGVTFTYRFTDVGGRWTKDVVVRPTDCGSKSP
jgi:hypothetical protein